MNWASCWGLLTKLANIKPSLVFVLRIFHPGSVVSDVIVVSRNGVNVALETDAEAPSPSKIRRRRISKPALKE